MLTSVCATFTGKREQPFPLFMEPDAGNAERFSITMLQTQREERVKQREVNLGDEDGARDMRQVRRGEGEEERRRESQRRRKKCADRRATGTPCP